MSHHLDQTYAICFGGPLSATGKQWVFFLPENKNIVVLHGYLRICKKCIKKKKRKKKETKKTPSSIHYQILCFFFYLFALSDALQNKESFNQSYLQGFKQLHVLFCIPNSFITVARQRISVNIHNKSISLLQMVLYYTCICN